MLTLSFVIGVILSLFPPPRLNNRGKAPEIPQNEKEFYSEYLRSPKYRNGIRKERLKHDNYQCQNWHFLPVRKGLEVHHLTYDRLGKERKSDLITLCRKCHQKEHNK